MTKIPEAVEWRNRIVGSGVKQASQFLANPKNWRFHPKSQQIALRGALNEVGFIAPVIENIRTGYLVDGHERVWEALENNDCEVPFIQIDVDEAEEDLILATLDPIGAMATADKEKLDELLRDIQTGEAGLQEMLAELAENNDIAKLADDRRAKDMLGTMRSVDGYDFELDAQKLGYRLEAVIHCDKRDRALELFAGLGILSYWYGRSFSELIRVDESPDGKPDFISKAERWLTTEFDSNKPFDFVDFDDEGCPNEAIQIFFDRIKNTDWPQFVISLTDGNGLNLKPRGRQDMQKRYRFGEVVGTRKSTTELYEAFPALVENHVLIIAEEAGYSAERINLHRGSHGNVVYGSYLIKRTKAALNESA
jgi:hypothetical protein